MFFKYNFKQYYEVIPKTIVIQYVLNFSLFPQDLRRFRSFHTKTFSHTMCDQYVKFRTYTFNTYLHI